MAKVTPEVLEKTLTKYNAVIQQEFDAVETSIAEHEQDGNVHMTAEEKAKLQSVTNIVFFTPDTHYDKDTILLHKGDADTNYSMYICTIEHTSGATFDEDEANWEFVIGKQGFLHVSDAQPAETNVLWVDIADANNPVLKFYNGTAWIELSGTGGTEEFLRESDIVATLDGTVTNKQIIGALALKEKIDDLVKGIGITQVTDLYPEDIRYFPLGKFRFSSNDIASNFIELPELGKACTLEVSSISSFKTLDQVYCYRFYRVVTCEGAEYTRALNTAANAGVIASDTGWRSVTTISVPDVPVTEITSFKDTNIKNIGNSCYCVENGWCHLTLEVQFSTDGAYGWNNVIDTTVYNIPIPKMKSGTTKATLSSNAVSPKTIIVAPQGGGLGIYGHVSSGEQYFGSVSYPVAEDWRP